MAESFAPRLKTENSIIMSGAVVALTIGLYTGVCGPVSVAQKTPPNDGSLMASKKKAGLTALAGVGAIALIARDPNIVILGGATIIAMELMYRHAISADPDSGQIVAPGPQAYQPAQNVVPLAAQGPAVSYG
jgi:hypothetical protein